MRDGAEGKNKKEKTQKQHAENFYSKVRMKVNSGQQDTETDIVLFSCLIKETDLNARLFLEQQEVVMRAEEVDEEVQSEDKPQRSLHGHNILGSDVL